MNSYTEYDFDPRNLAEDLRAAIGLVVVNSAQTENVLKQVISGCLKIDTEYGGALTTHMTIPLKFDIVRAVAEIKIDDIDDLNELDILLDHCKEGFDERNALVHSPWCRDPTGNAFILQESARATYKFGLIPMEKTQVLAKADYIYHAGMDLWSFLMRLGLLPPHPPEGRTRFHKTKSERTKARKARLKRASA